MESNCSRFKIGTESVEDFRNIRVSYCVVRDCGAVAVKDTAVDGRSVENARFDNLEISDSTGPVFRANGDRKRRYMDSADPEIRSDINNVHFDNTRVTTRRYARTTQGRGVTFRNVDVAFADCTESLVNPDCRPMRGERESS